MQEISLWGIATIAGPIVLLILFAYVIFKNRSTKIPRDVTEQATKENYAAEDHAHKAEVQARQHDVQARKDETL